MYITEAYIVQFHECSQRAQIHVKKTYLHKQNMTSTLGSPLGAPQSLPISPHQRTTVTTSNTIQHFCLYLQVIKLKSYAMLPFVCAYFICGVHPCYFLLSSVRSDCCIVIPYVYLTPFIYPLHLTCFRLLANTNSVPRKIIMKVFW